MYRRLHGEVVLVVAVICLLACLGTTTMLNNTKTTQLKDGEDEMDDMTTSQRPRSHETTATRRQQMTCGCSEEAA